jgi:CubicO group peptidase (beta-lactamase class C family)
MKFLLIFLLSGLSVYSKAQTYFPPIDPKAIWEQQSPASLGWCNEQVDSLLNYLGDQESKGFILLKDGKIVLEKYYGTFTKDSLWYWASAGKTLTSFLIGKAQEEKLLDINEPSSNYLGKGWSNCTSEQEDKINIRHHLTMTTGLNDKVTDNHCTTKSCLVYLADAGTRWAYHNAPYTLLETILTNATKTSAKSYTDAKVADKIGMKGWWIKSNYDNVYYSNLRSIARFGLLIQNNAIWEKDTLLKDTSYFRQMTTTSQSINPSYGYLWWLNGKSSYMVPTLQLKFPGPYAPNAPLDVISAIGKNGQIISISKSTGLMYVRMGNQKNQGEVSIPFVDSIWRKVNALYCKTNTVHKNDNESFNLYPNPANDELHIQIPDNHFNIKIYNLTGNLILESQNEKNISISDLQKGMYFLELKSKETNGKRIFIKSE